MLYLQFSVISVCGVVSLFLFLSAGSGYSRLTQGMIAMWLKEGGAENALLHIRYAQMRASSSSSSAPPPPLSPWTVIDDAELFSGARACLQQVFSPTTHHNCNQFSKNTLLGPIQTHSLNPFHHCGHFSNMLLSFAARCR
jgi:hypothetical protein